MNSFDSLETQPDIEAVSREIAAPNVGITQGII
jgi:hypothetical protein